MKKFFLLIGGIIVWMILTFLIYSAKFETSGDKIIGFVTMTTSLAGLVGIYFAYLQIISIKSQENESQKIRNEEFALLKAQKSVELADEFRSILNDCFLLANVYNSNETYISLIESVDYGSLKSFRYTELGRIFSKKGQIEILENKFQYMFDNFKTTIDNFETYEKIPRKFETIFKTMEKHDFKESNLFKSLFTMEYTQESVNVIKSRISSEEELKQKFYLFGDIISDFKSFKLDIINRIDFKSSDVLNHLEVFSMAINLGLADDSPLYPSLHQAFLDTVRILYPHIAKQNNGEHTDHFYIHIRKLYKKWSERYDDEVKSHKSI